jgi:outer membrane protein assembly complex protein YaeT
MKKRWLKLMVGILSGIVCSLVLLFALLQTSAAQRFAFQRLSNYLRGQSGINLQVSELHLDILRGTASLKGVSIQSLAAPDLPPLFGAARIDIKFSIRDIIRRNWIVKELRLSNPSINYYVGQNGRTNLPKSAGTSGTAPDILIAHAEAIDGSFIFQDLQSDISFTLSRWRLSVDGNPLTRSHHIAFACLQESSFEYQSHTIPINFMEFSATLAKAALQIEHAQLAVDGSRIIAAGSLNDFSKPTLDLRLTPSLDIRRIARIAGIHEPIQGSISGTIQLTGGLNDIGIAAQLRGSKISVFNYKDVSFDLKSRTEWLTDAGKVTVHAFDFASPQGSINGRAALFLGSKPGTNSIEATVRDLSLSPLWMLLRPPFDLDSRTTGKIALKWKGAFDPAQLSGSTFLNLAATREVTDLNLLPVTGVLDARMEPNRIFGNVHSLTVFETQVDGIFSLSSFKEINGDFTGDTQDIDILLAQLSPFLGKSDPLLGMELSGPFHFNAQISGSLSQPNIFAAVDAPQLQAGQLKELAVKADATLQDSRIAFRGTIAMSQDLAVIAQGNLDLQGPIPVLDLDARTDRISLTAIPLILDSEIPAKGNLKASLHMNGPTDNLAGNASITADELFLDEEPLGRLDADVGISGGEIQSTRFRLNKNPQDPATDYLDGQFTYSPDSSKFQFQASGKNLTWETLTLSDGSPVQGMVNLIASGTGTIDQPSIDMKLECGDLKIGQKSFGAISASGTLRNDQIAIETTAPRFNLSSTALITGRDPYDFTIQLQARDADVSNLGLELANGQSVAGLITAHLSGDGNLINLAEAHFSALIQNLKLQIGKLEVHTQEPVQLEYRDNSIEIPSSATIAGGNSTIEITGRIPIRQPAPEGALRLKGRLDLAQAMEFLPESEGLAVTGTLNLDVALSGAPQKISGEGAITLDGGTIELPQISVPLTGVTLLANIQDGSLVLQRADAAWGQGEISIAGRFPFGLLPQNLPVQFPRDEGPATFSVDLKNFKPESIGILPQGITGLISAHAAGQADRADLQALNAQIVFNNFDFKVNDIRFSQKEPITIAVRDGIASILRLSANGAQANIEATGSAGLFPKAPIDLQLVGNIDAALFAFISQDPKIAGTMQFQIAAGGNLESPVLSGLATMKGGRVSLRNPRVVADSLTVRLSLLPNQISVQEFTGTLNGGSISLTKDTTGTIGYGNGTLNDLDLKFTLQDVFLNFPEGLKSVSGGNLTIASSDDAILIGGNLRATESSYREPFVVGSRLMSYLRTHQTVETGQAPSPFLSRIRMNVAIRDATPLQVQNNLAKVEADANLRLVGSFYEPSMVGRITLSEGGQIVLNQRTYYITKGTITLANQNYIEPELNIEATTKVSSYDITLQLTGTVDKPVTTMTSVPPTSESDILSLLLTGKTASQTQTPGAVPTQTLSWLAGQAGEALAHEAQRTLHLSTVQINPGLIASESDTGARLTLGEDITKDLSLVYSMNLVNGGDQIWAAQYTVSRQLTARATKQADNSYRFEFRHDLRFGGADASGTARPAEKRAAKPSVPKFVIGSIKFEGAGPLYATALPDIFKIKPGDRYEFPKVQKGLDRLRDFYTDQKYLEADMRLHRETQQQTIDLQLNIEPGPILEFTFDGFTVSGSIKEQVKTAWINGAFDTERFEDATAAIRRSLIQDGYLQSQVTHSLETDDGKKIVHFHIAPGIIFSDVILSFPGTAEISAAQLTKAIDQADLRPDIYADPQKAVDYLKRYYNERGYLQARIDMPQPQLDPRIGRGETAIPIYEGPQFTIGDLEFSGNHVFNYDQLWFEIPTSSGSSYDPNTLRDAVRKLEKLYRSKGYNDATIAFRVIQDSKTPHANVTFEIIERRQSIIRDIVIIEENREISSDFVQRQLDFRIGDILNFARIDETRKRLYAAGVYTSVDFRTEEIPGSTPNDREKAMRIRIRLREIQPYRLQYGLFYDTERGVGGLLEAQNLNVLGRASNLGLSLRYDTDLKEGRLYFNEPFIRQIHVKMDATAFVQRETRTAFTANRIGFSLFRQKELAKKYRFDYGYRYDHVRWEGLAPDPTIFQASVPVARLIGTITRDTRDSILDPTRGEFTSHSFEFGPRPLGSEIGFMRYSGQYFRYVPLAKYFGKPIKDKEGQPLPTNLVYAGAIRLGLTSAFGGKDIISPERFFAGGGTTMRGFKQDMMGPLETQPDGTVRPFGGEALFLFNNELRFPIVGILQGVGFLDVGNVYSQISDFNFNLRKSAGGGLRLKIKFIPLRFDYGFKLDRKPGESGSAFFISIGQAF